MLASQPQNKDDAILLTPRSGAANTAGATGGWVSVHGSAGPVETIEITQIVGTVTAGSITGAIEHADDGSGTNAEAVPGASFAAVTTANDPQSQTIALRAHALKPFFRYVGTIVTGPADVAVVARRVRKYA